MSISDNNNIVKYIGYCIDEKKYTDDKFIIIIIITSSALF